MTTTELYTQLLTLIEQGDEKGAKMFLLDNFNDFPEDVREKVAFAFFEEAVHAEAAGIDAEVAVQKEGKQLLGELGEVEQILRDAQKAIDIKETM